MNVLGLIALNRRVVVTAAYVVGWFLLKPTSYSDMIYVQAKYIQKKKKKRFTSAPAISCAVDRSRIAGCARCYILRSGSWTQDPRVSEAGRAGEPVVTHYAVEASYVIYDTPSFIISSSDLLSSAPRCFRHLVENPSSLFNCKYLNNHLFNMDPRENAIQSAIRDLESGVFPSQTAAAKAYNIPRITLISRLHAPVIKINKDRLHYRRNFLQIESLKRTYADILHLIHVHEKWPPESCAWIKIRNHWERNE